MIDFNKIRKQYPGCRNYVYLDNASSGIVSNETRKAAEWFYKDINRNGNFHLPEWLDKMEEARMLLAKLLNARVDEVAFAPNTSTGMNIFANMLKGAGEVIINDLEFPSSTFPWINQDFKVHFVKSSNGSVPLERIEKAITSKTKIIVSSHVQYGTGFKQDAEKLGKIARKNKHYFVLNATQSLGALLVDVKKFNVDFLCFTGIKWLCSGEGAGGLFIKKENLSRFKPPLAGWFSTKEPLLFNNKKLVHKQSAGRFELGGLGLPNIFALGSSIKQRLEIGIENISERILHLTDELIEGLKERGFELISPIDRKRRSGIVTVKVREYKRVVQQLRNSGVLVSGRGGGIRIAAHFYNNSTDIKRFLAALTMFAR
ncbi:MAG: aminotransferase class V-fold PLP-dependent enzyme [Planctomycetota bacterium]